MRRLLHPVCLLLAGLLIAGCGGDDEGGKRASFPAAGGRSLEQILGEAGGGSPNAPVLAPSVSVLRPGRDRYGFGLFTANRENLTDVESVAVYVAPGSDLSGRARGPYAARIESLDVERRFESKTTSGDPASAKVVYIANVKFPRKGPYAVGALVRRGGSIEATGPVGAVVKDFSEVPAPGKPAPRISTPTSKSVDGDLSKIDTRDPHDTMHDVNFASVLGRRPVVLVFATPALCESRTCGPVVDVAEQVKARYGRQADFIHMEIYRDNDPDKGFRPQVGAFGLPTEPFVFLIDRRGRVFESLEGAFSVRELSAGVRDLVRRRQ